MAGSEVSGRDFQHLIAYAPYRALVGPFVRRNYGVLLESEGSATRLVRADGRAVDPAALHVRICGHHASMVVARRCRSGMSPSAHHV